LADKSATQELWHYLRSGSKAGSYPPLTELPAGAREYTRVNVIRE
jgi:hypothetical protein